MPSNPLEKSIRSAVRMNEELSKLFAEAGNVPAGRGYVVKAYANANRALAQALQESDPRFAARDVMYQLKHGLSNDLRSAFTDATQSGMDESARQLRFYGIHSDPAKKPMDLTKQVNIAVDAVIAQIDSQEALLQALLMNEMDSNLILGDENRQGVLKQSDVLTGSDYWLAALIWDSFSLWSQAHQREAAFQKQAIAALDARTTDCCLRVHGQIVGLNAKFHLTGTPRFADNLDWTPFHWKCRTSVVLYLEQFDAGLTDRMRKGARYVLSQRQLGKTPDQHPADAFWK